MTLWPERLPGTKLGGLRTRETLDRRHVERRYQRIALVSIAIAAVVAGIVAYFLFLRG